MHNNGGRSGRDVKRLFEILHSMILELQRVAWHLRMPEVANACDELLDKLEEIAEDVGTENDDDSPSPTTTISEE